MTRNIEWKLEQIKKKKTWLESRLSGQPEKSAEEVGGNWFKQKNAPIAYDEKTNAFVSSLQDDQSTYLSYYEKDTNFSLAPDRNKTGIRGGQTYHVEFSGQSSSKLTATLILMTYNKGEKGKVYPISLNQAESIFLPEEVDAVRLAIKISGPGQLQIHSIMIGGASFWNASSVNAKARFSPIGKTQWYMPNNSKIHFNPLFSQFSVDLSNDEYVYFPYKEASVNFNQPPQYPLAINHSLAVAFEGEKDASLNVKLCIVSYKDSEKQQVYEVDLNNKRIIHLPEDISSLRLAIRVAGKGNFTVSNVAISGIGYWLNKNIRTKPVTDYTYDYYVKLNQNSLFGLEKVNNLVLYHEFDEIFESKMIGNQFAYFPCIEDSPIAAAPIQTFFKPKAKHYYEFDAGASVTGNVELALIIEGYRNGKRQELHQVYFNQKSSVVFKENTTHIKVFLRVKGQGYFQGAYIGVNQHPIEITNSLEVSVDKNDWFVTAPKMLTLSNEDGVLKGHSSIERGRNLYISYKEENNNYNIPPKTMLLPVQQDSVYEFFVKAEMEDGVQVLPMLISYAGKKKEEVLQLRMNARTIVTPQPGVTQFRLALRISGKGKFQLKKFTVVEMPVINVNRSLDFIDNHEVNLLKLVPPKPLKELKMAVIFDEFTTASYKEECKLITFTPENWLEVLTNDKPDLLMVESAWNGNNGTWNKRVGYYGEENMKPLFELIRWCNANNVPTVFWNKEDPVHFNRFIETAKRFDYIFTTDENMVPHYQEQAGHKNVYALPFAAQPIIHNPIKIVEERENKACFAGSYYRHHEDRSIDMDRVLDYAAKYGLEIYDRNYEKTMKGLMPNHRFPERFDPYIKGSLKYYEIDKAYKGYKVMINVNTVKYSPTMFSRRVFEGLACGTPVISTYAQGIENLFGDLVYISENEQDIDEAFNTLLNNEEEYRRKSLLGIREVLSKHTYTHRLKYIAEKVGLNVKSELPKVTIIGFASSKQEFMNLLQQFERQSYENKELYVLVDTFAGYLELFNKYNNANVKTFVRSYMHNYQNIREWIDAPYIAYFSQRDYYGTHYLMDLMLSTTFTDSDFIGKHAYFAFDHNKDELIQHNGKTEYEFVTSLSPSRTIAKTNVFTKESLEDLLIKIQKGEDFGVYLKYGKKMYSSDCYNYISDAYHTDDQQTLLNVVNQIEI
jgi:spore maturation protein CgeB